MNRENRRFSLAPFLGGCLAGDRNGIDGAAVFGVGDFGVPAALRLGDDGGIFSHDPENLRRGVGAHAAADAAGGVNGDGHGGPSLVLVSPIVPQKPPSSKNFFRERNFLAFGNVLTGITALGPEQEGPGETGGFLFTESGVKPLPLGMGI